MTQTTSDNPSVTEKGSDTSTAVAPKGTGALDSSHGRTSVADTVVTKIAGIATREVSGVHELGRGSARAMGQLRQRIPGSSGPSVSQGVSVEVGETQAAIDVDVVVEYGVSIADLARGIRRNVISSVERMTGLEVVEVNVSVDDVYIAGDEDDEQSSSRVQ